jgi:hypothetical protein
MAEGKAGAVAIDAGAPAEERCRAAIDLTGAVVARTAGEHELN